VSAKIIRLCDWRTQIDPDPEIDLYTAVDVAIRDLVEIEALWGTDLALERLTECRRMLRMALAITG
jgi:hypothetical protein